MVITMEYRILETATVSKTETIMRAVLMEMPTGLTTLVMAMEEKVEISKSEHFLKIAHHCTLRTPMLITLLFYVNINFHHSIAAILVQ